MKYIAIIDEGQTELKEKIEQAGINLKPLWTYLLVNKNGNSVYLRQNYIDCLKEFAENEITKSIIEQDRFFCDQLNELKETQ